MRFNNLKMLFCFMIGFFIIFINVFTVSADEFSEGDGSGGGSSSGGGAFNGCSCYYYAYLETDDDGDKNAYRTDYLLELDWYEEDNAFPNVVSFCEKGQRRDNESNGKCENKGAKVVFGSTNNLPLLSEYEEHRSYIVSNNCVLSACSIHSIWFSSFMDSKEIFLTDPSGIANPSTILRFISISKEEYEKLKSSSDVAGTADDMDLSDPSTPIIEPENVLWWKEDSNYTLDDVGKPCSTFLNSELIKILKIAFILVSVGGIVLVVVLTAIGFVKAIVSSDEDALKKAFKNLLTRIIVIVVLLLLPLILSFVIDLVNSVSSNGVVQIGGDNEIFCGVADD